MNSTEQKENLKKYVHFLLDEIRSGTRYGEETQMDSPLSTLFHKTIISVLNIGEMTHIIKTYLNGEDPTEIEKLLTTMSKHYKEFQKGSQKRIHDASNNVINVVKKISNEIIQTEDFFRNNDIAIPFEALIDTEDGAITIAWNNDGDLSFYGYRKGQGIKRIREMKIADRLLYWKYIEQFNDQYEKHLKKYLKEIQCGGEILDLPKETNE